jgi:ABC-2 type transport system permease protein
MNRVLAMARKEVYHILRDRRSLGVAILMPLAMVLVFGFAIDMELKHLPVAFLDEDHSPASRKLILDMTSSGFIVDVARLNGRGEIEPGFRSSRFRAAVVIPRHFARRLHEDASSTVQILIDGADGTTAATVDNYLNSVLQRFNRALAGTSPGAAVGASVVPVDPRLRIDFNPELVSAYFVVPGLVAVILMMICALLTSIALAREKETGTLEQVLTTPVTPLQVIVGKLLPYVGLGAIDAALVLGVGRFVFGVPMEGSWWVLAAYSLVYILIALSLGLLISALAGSQRVAMMVALVATYLPSLILSGFIFELHGMPLPLRLVGEIIPATHYIRIVHGILLKGEFWFGRDLAVMLVLLLVFTGAATRRFRATLE